MVAVRPPRTVETFDWLEPSPLWGGAPASPTRYQPAVVELTTDAFMDEFLAIAPDADRLGAAVVAPAADDLARSLYLPIHGRFYLVAASLTCRLPGFPDRVVRTADDEAAFFVLRRLQGNPDDGWVEQAWVQEGPTKGWHTLPGDPRALLPCEIGKEERLPLFPVPACTERTLLAGYLATSSREMYPVPASQIAPDADAEDTWQTDFPDARIEILKATFFDQAAALTGAPVDEPSEDPTVLRLSVYLLLGFWEFLNDHLPNAARALHDDVTGSLTAAERDVVDALDDATLSADLTLAEALGEVARRRSILNTLGDDDPLPDVFEDVAGYNLASVQIADDDVIVDERTLSVTPIYEAIYQALQLEEDTQTVELPKFAVDGSELFVVRCVYERPQCEPKQVWMSQASIPFRLAPLYDPDAPARTIQLALPMDLSMAGLRRMQKGVSVQLSPALRQKMANVNLLDTQLGGDALGVAMICTFSIPIITLCAFVLLMVLVIALNIAFWWLPFFRICVPVRRS